MKYLVITADYNSSGLKDEFEGELNRTDIELTDEIWESLDNWVAEYQGIIPLDQQQRSQSTDRIKKLDDEGLSIKQKIIEHFEGNVKIKYYSEGLLSYIP